MEENTINTDEIKEKDSDLKPKEHKKSSKKEKKDKKTGFFSERKAEFKKITWPSKKELVKQTVTVIIVSLVVATIIFGLDSLIGFGYEKVTQIIDAI